MIVSREIFQAVLDKLSTRETLSVDTETTGLKPYHGDRLFSIIIADQEEAYYFNFQAYEGLQPISVLLPESLQKLQALFSDPSKTWYTHNAKFDMAILAREGIEINGTIHCTQAAERVVFNDYLPGGYDLGSCAARIQLSKDDTVDKFIDEHKLWTYTGESKPGAREKLKHFDRVPFPIISLYGEQDARITFALGQSQEKAIKALDDQTKESNPKLPLLQNILQNERRLTKTVGRMEARGVKIDRPYCVRAARYEADRANKSKGDFKVFTGREYLSSGKLFSEIFKEEESKWSYTEAGNPSFDSDALAKLENPAAKHILEYRDAKSKSDFYRGFLWHADEFDIIHPTFNPAGTATGRFSSSSPNFQNLTAEEDEASLREEFVVRRAIIPRPGFCFIMPDYDQMEYRMMFDYACTIWGSETPLVKKIKHEGLDPHQATADLVTSMGRMQLTRKVAKNANFAELYGSGIPTLAGTIKGTEKEARALKDALREAAPEIRNLVDTVSSTARVRRFVRNWAGRRSYLSDQNFAYKMTNYLIQGGCADVNKFALNQIDEYLLTKKSKLVLTIHDENPIEVHESELGEVPKRIKEIMEGIYPHKYLPLTCGMEYSWKSLGDKLKGYPV